MKNTLETRLGLFVALVVFASFLIINTVGGLDKFRRGLHVHALFNTAQELKIGDRVKMAGVEVGRVESVGLATNKVKVTMKLHLGTAVKTDSTATIKFAGLLGQNFVSMDFGSPGARLLEDNQYIATARKAGDNASADLLEVLLKDEEEHVDFLESQLSMTKELGLANYLAQQMHGAA